MSQEFLRTKRERKITTERENDYGVHRPTASQIIETYPRSIVQFPHHFVPYSALTEKPEPFRTDRLVTSAIEMSFVLSIAGTVIGLSIQGLPRRMCEVDPS